MANRKKSLDLEKMKKSIIKILNSKKNKNNSTGFYEWLLIEDLVLVKEESDFKEIYFKLIKSNFEDNADKMSEYLDKLYDNLIFTDLKEFIKDLVQENIKNKVLSGKATYAYIFGVAPYASYSWVLPSYNSSEATRQIKSIYFYKYIDELLRPNNFFTESQRKNILEEYLEKAKHPKDVIISFFEDPEETLKNMDDVNFEYVLQRALKYSF